MSKDKIAKSELQVTVDSLKTAYQPRVGSSLGPGFHPGHKKFGGRVRGSQNKRTKLALEICQELNFHSAAFLATCALTGQMPNPDGSSVPISTEDRLRAATALAPFCMPKLQATQLSGNPDAPLAVDSGFDINVLLADPAAVEAAQTLALKLEGCQEPTQRPKQLPAGDQE